jgi:hypothetical protein
MKNVNSINLVGDRLQSVVTYIYIASRMQLFELDTTNSFPNK